MTNEERAAQKAAVLHCIKCAGSLEDLSDRVGVAKSTVYRWLSGDVEISAEYAAEIAREFGLRLQDLRPDLEVNP